MRRSGDKLAARTVADSLGIPTGAGSQGLKNLEHALACAESLNGYPLLLKASAGGGGRGMTIVRAAEDLIAGYSRSSAEAEKAFGDGTLYLEPYIEKARHIEVQILADKHGNVCHLGERDCSAQRRYQKIIEEAPSVGLPDSLVNALRTAAVSLCKELKYFGAATVEFLVDVKRETFVFLEINARVQVEHPVTEEVTGIDIVREQIRIARGEPLSFKQSQIAITGHAIECRINAEDPYNDFRPSPGKITVLHTPGGHGVRVDSHVYAGYVIPPYYDSMIGKLITVAQTREEAINTMYRALSEYVIEGVKTTIPFHLQLMQNEDFRKGNFTTKFLETFTMK
jgi:acetyl-CoA carboxylase biotin carboxylase subunit